MAAASINFSRDARIPFIWTWRQLAALRTLATRAVALPAPVPSALAAWANTLLGPAYQELFPDDATDQVTPRNSKGLPVPTSTALKAAFKKACPAFSQSFRLHSQDMYVLACRELSFHHDEVWSEAHAYVVWFLAMDKPMTLYFGEQSVPVSPGVAIVLDAQQLHALVREGARSFQRYAAADMSHRVVFALGLTSLRPRRAREALGVRSGRVDSPGFERIRTASALDYCEESGRALAWRK